MIKVKSNSKPSVLIDNAPNIDWRDAQRHVEAKLFVHLNVPATHGVIYLNRATNGLDAVCWYLHHYKAVWHMRWGSHQYSSTNRIFHSYFVNKPRAEYTQRVHWAGCSPIDSGPAILHDCAQSCHGDFFTGYRVERDNYFMFSFESSKPIGSPAGGGAVVVPLDAVDPIRNYAMPPNNYYNPRSEQCIGTSLTLDEGHLKWLGRYFENNREIHGNLIGMLDRDFEVFSDRTTNLTPTMCLLKPRHDKALDKLTKVAGIKFEIRSMFDGLIAIPTDSWYVVDTLSPVYT